MSAPKQIVDIESKQFKPKKEYLLIKPAKLDSEKTLDSGLVIPVSTKGALDRPTFGEVIAVGSDIEDIKEGEYILWPATDGLDFEFNDGDFMLLRYASVIGSVKK